MNKKIITILIMMLFMFSFIQIRISGIFDDEEMMILEDNINIPNMQGIKESNIFTDDQDFFNEGNTITNHQDVAVILVKFKDISSTLRTRGEIENIIDDNITRFFRNCSWGEIELEAHYSGWFDLSGDCNDYFSGCSNWGSLNCDKIVREAVTKADDDIDFSIIERILVINNNPDDVGRACFTWTGCEGISGKIKADGNDLDLPWAVVGSDGFTLDRSFWSNIAHELGHTFKLPHLSNDEYKIPFDVMESYYPAPMFSSWSRTRDYLQWMDDSNGLLVLSEGFSGRIKLRPLERDISGTQAIKIPITNKQYYLIENRRYDDFDDHIRIQGADEGVVIYKCHDKGDWDSGQVTVVDRTYVDGSDTDLLDSSWLPTEKFTSNVITLEVQIIDEDTRDGSYNLSINYGDKLNLPDTRITPWADPPWETDDIWVDNELINNWNEYEFNDGNIHNPNGIGDTPVTGTENRVYARVHNDGDEWAYDVDVKFYEADFGIGMPWTPIGQTTIPSIENGKSEKCFIPWDPKLDTTEIGLVKVHRCIKVEVIPIPGDPGELDDENQIAQENIDWIEVPTSTNINKLGAYSGTIKIGNPLDEKAFIHLFVYDAPQDWNVILDEEYMELLPGETQEIDFIANYPGLLIPGIPEIIEFRATATTEGTNDAVITFIGGMEYVIKPVEILIINPESPEPNNIIVGEPVTIFGKISQTLQDLKVWIEFIPPNNQSTFYVSTVTNNNGEFSYTYYNSSIVGEWKVRIYTGGNEYYSSASSSDISFNVTGGENHPPGIPSITGEINGETGAEYTYTVYSIDPENDQIRYFFDWGDGSTSGWTDDYSSGEECEESHIWNQKGTYLIKVKAKDNNDAESEWATLEISMPKNKMFYQINILFERLMKHFSLTCKLFYQLL